MLSEFFVNFTLQGTQQWPEPQFLNRMLKQKMKKRLKATPHNSKCRYGERGAADAKPKCSIILDAAKVSAASGGNSEPKQGQRSQSARGFCPRSTMRVPQPDIIEHFGSAVAVPQLPERCLSRKAGIVREKSFWRVIMLLEVCVDSLASARAAIAGGADRLELCSALLAGGLTPYTELLRQIRHESDVAVRCLMRPRAGDFLYMPEEIEMMCVQITELRSAGANGFVIGCLNPDGTLDCTATARLAKAANGAGLTLHRAIDVSADPLQTYRDAAALGIDTVLTSGAAASCVQGVDVLCSLLAERDRTNGPEVLIGAGVNAGVIRQLSAALPGARAYHMSGKVELESRMVFRHEGVPMGLPGLDEWHIQQTDTASVRAARQVLDDLA